MEIEERSDKGSVERAGRATLEQVGKEVEGGCGVGVIPGVLEKMI